MLKVKIKYYKFYLRLVCQFYFSQFNQVFLLLHLESPSIFFLCLLTSFFTYFFFELPFTVFYLYRPNRPLYIFKLPLYITVIFMSRMNYKLINDKIWTNFLILITKIPLVSYKIWFFTIALPLFKQLLILKLNWY